MRVARGWSLKLRGWFRGASGRLQVLGAVLKEDGEWSWFQTFVDSGGADSWVEQVIQLPAGEMISCAAEMVTADTNYGDVYASVEVMATVGGASPWLASLCRGWVGTDQAVSWPQSGVPGLLDSKGPLQRRAIADPDAGSDASVTLDGWGYRRLVSLTGQLETDANVASRVVAVEVLDGSARVGRWYSSSTASDSETFLVTAGPNLDDFEASGNNLMIVIPEMSVQEGMVVRFLTTAIQSGDQWTECAISGEEYPGL